MFIREMMVHVVILNGNVQLRCVYVSHAGDITTEREPAAPDSPAYTVPYQVGVVAMDIILYP